MGRKRRSNLGPYLLHVELLRERIPAEDQFPYNLPAVCHLQNLSFHPKVTFFIGENGTGKSTLLEALAVLCDLNPEGGSRNFNFATGPLSFATGRLPAAGTGTRLAWGQLLSCGLRVSTMWRRRSALDKDDPDSFWRPPPLIKAYGEQALHEQSHGESFFSLFQNRFRANGLYLMDEPEAADHRNSRNCSS